MNPNEKLTNAIRGRSVADFENANGTLTVRFQDGTLMRVRALPETATPLSPGAKVVQVTGQVGHLELHLEDGTTVAFSLSDPHNAVSVRDDAGKVLYLG
ncbi:MAG TPA: hypothetical protein VGD78_06415 [Chthoniobacterales bacterium]